MLMLIHIEKVFSKRDMLQKAPVGWAMQGRAFVIRDREALIRRWLPLFFRHAKFPSFTRKLYRWGFRQISTPRGFDSSSNRELYFFNQNFNKHKKWRMSKMESTTAESKRYQQEEQERRANAQADHATNHDENKNRTCVGEGAIFNGVQQFEAGETFQHMREPLTTGFGITLDRFRMPPSLNQPTLSSDLCPVQVTIPPRLPSTYSLQGYNTLLPQDSLLGIMPYPQPAPSPPVVTTNQALLQQRQAILNPTVQFHTAEGGEHHSLLSMNVSEQLRTASRPGLILGVTGNRYMLDNLGRVVVANGSPHLQAADSSGIGTFLYRPGGTPPL